MENQTIKQKNLPKLTRQDVKFVDKVIETGNLTKSAQESFEIKDPNYAGVKGHRLIRKDKIINAIEVKRKSLKNALIEKGITEEKIADKINVLLEASKPIFKNNNSTGEIEQVGEEIDYTAIDKGLKHATNIYGIEDLDKPKSTNVYNFIFNEQFREKVKPLEDALIEQFKNVKPEETD